MKKTLFIVTLFIISIIHCTAQDNTVYVYGPGGPYPPIKEAAEMFEQKFNIPVQITKGPLKNWQEQATENADIFFSGSENMMSSFAVVFEEEILPETIYPLYFRGSGLIVRKGNPKRIRKLADLQREEVKILVVNGAGLTGVWDDILGSMKDMSAFRKIRSNIVFHAENSGVAEKYWNEHPEVDVWITWNIWQISNAESADFIKLKEKQTIYRDCGVALSKSGIQKENARQFYEFLKSKDVENIFKKWGWQ